MQNASRETPPSPKSVVTGELRFVAKATCRSREAGAGGGEHGPRAGGLRVRTSNQELLGMFFGRMNEKIEELSRPRAPAGREGCGPRSVCLGRD